MTDDVKDYEELENDDAEDMEDDAPSDEEGGNENTEDDKKLDDEKTKEIVRRRLKQANETHAKREAELKAQLEEARAKLSAANDSVSSSAQNPQAQPAPNQHQYTHEQMLAYAEQKKKADEFNSKLQEAVEEDSEFKKLVDTGNPVPAHVLFLMQHLDNSPALAKHLLKDKKDHRLMEAADKAGEYQLVKFLNDLSDKIEKTSTKPGASKFKSAPDLTDVGEAGEDFDLHDYIKNKRV